MFATVKAIVPCSVLGRRAPNMQNIHVVDEHVVSPQMRAMNHCTAVLPRDGVCDAASEKQ